MAPVIAFIADVIIVAAADAGVTGLALTAINILATAFAYAVVIGGLTAISSLLAPRPKIPRPEDGRIPFREPTPSRQSGFGRYRTSGPYMCYEVDPKANSVDILALHHGRIDAFEQWYLHEDPITIEANHLGLNVVSSANSNVYATCNIDWRFGLDSETPYSRSTSLLGPNAFGDGQAALWPTTSVGDGIASCELICYAADQDWFQRRYPNGLPRPSVVIRAQLVYDWRDNTQSLTDSSTWKWSENPVLCLAAYLTYAPGGMAMTWAQRIAPALSMWTTAANVCDEAVALAAGGTQPRYVVGGMYRHDNEPADVIQALLASFDGWLGETGDGSFAIYAGAYSAPTLTITGDWITDYSVQLLVPDEEACNELVVRFCSNQHRYTLVEATPWVDTADQEARGRTVNRTIELAWVCNYAQARRLAKREVSRTNMGVRGTVTTNVAGLQALGQRYVELDLSDELPSIGLIAVEIRKIELDLGRGGVTITWVKADPNIDAWNPTTEEGTPPIVPVISRTQGAPTPTNVTAVAVYAGSVAGGGQGVALQVSWDNAARQDVSYRVQYRLTNAGGGQPGPWNSINLAANTIDRALARLTLLTPFVDIDSSYDVQVCSVSAHQAVSDPSSPPLTVSTSSAAIAPNSPTAFTGSGGAGSATLNWTNPTSSNLAGEQLIRAPQGDAISAGTLITTAHGALGAAVSYTDSTVTAGNWSYWVQAVNASGEASAPAGPVNVTVT